MDSFEWNKVFAAILTGALLVMGIKTLVIGGHGDHHVDLAYTIEVPEEGTPVDVVVEEGPSLAELLVGADAAKGAKEFAKCKACHTITKGGGNGQGPNLYGIMGRTVASADGYGYSGALTDFGGAWTWDKMDAWLKSPKGAVPGNKMNFAGVGKDNKRADLLAYLNSQSDSPLGLPEVIVEAAEEAVEAVAEEVMN